MAELRKVAAQQPPEAVDNRSDIRRLHVTEPTRAEARANGSQEGERLCNVLQYVDRGHDAKVLEVPRRRLHVAFIGLDASPGREVYGSRRYVDADGSDERLLATDSSGIVRPIWDPTGRLIAFQTREGLYIVSVEDGVVHEIEELGGALMAWSPDGAWLAFSETVGRREFWVNRDLLGEKER